MHTIGLDLGGTKIKIGLIRSGQIIEERELDSHSDKGLEDKLPELKEVIDDLLTSNGVLDFSGIGVSIPGIVDVKEARLLTINDKYNDAVSMDLRLWAWRNWSKPLFMDNDARCAMVGEWKYGAAQGFDDVVMMTLGTGIGTSAVVGGELMRGSHFRGGILGGHISLKYDGLQCNCGNVGCAEAEASSWNLPNIIRSVLPESIAEEYVDHDFYQLFLKYRRGDAGAVKVVDHCIMVWSTALANLVYAYDPKIVVIGGGIMKSADIIIPKIKQNLADKGWFDFEQLLIAPAEYVHASALLSAEYFLNQQEKVEEIC
ncbi:ROK family protein [Aureibacter tunicatorum]|uniref:Glucokinase n=1 Tax=Aureibacter tunicatorum TaxID=866807 RepID=A0AAE3XI65_9BACT|nr:ROK family protein [Aureibacter tunicatorum]MDR6237288.1 glucokinase [Aureibacter tunicatorum]BDD06279.1 glucokinase [Aureibacter tunicatorum]